MNKKAKNLWITTLYLAAITAFLLLFSLSGTAAKQVEIEQPGILDAYQTGQTVTIKPANMTVGSITKQVLPTVFLPDGSAYNTAELKLSMAGVYRLEYVMEAAGEKYAASKSFTVYNPLAEVTGEGDEVHYGESQLYNTQGLLVSLSRESVFTYNKVINLKGSSKNQPFINLHVLPEEEGIADAQTLYLVLTDAHNALNKVTICIRKSSDIGVWNEHIAYVTAGASGQHLTGWVKGNGTGDDYKLEQITNYGTGLEFSFSGGLVNSASSALSVAFDWRAKSIHLLTQAKNYMVIDLDDDFPNPWGGFTNGEVYLSAYADRYTSIDSSKKFNVIIENIAGHTLDQELHIPENNLKANIDFGKYSQNSYPYALINHPYRVFDAYMPSLYGMENMTVRVFNGYDSAFKYEVDVTGGVFVPKDVGNYTIEYCITDRYGNPSVELVHVRALGQISDMQISLEDLDDVSKTGICGHMLTVASQFEVSNALGIPDVEVTAYHSASGKSAAVNDYGFVPEIDGVWVVEYVFTDYVSRQSLYSYEVTVEKGSQPIINISTVLPKYLIKNAYNPLPVFTAIDYTGNQPQAIAVKITASIGGVQTEIENAVFKPEVAGNAQITYEAVSAQGGIAQKSFTIPVIDVMFDGALDMSRYFEIEGSVTRLQTKTYVRLSATSTAYMEFIRPLLAQNISLSFNMAAGAKADQINIYLSDSVDGQSVKLSLFPAGTRVEVSVNDGKRTTLSQGLAYGGGSDFEISLNDNVLTISNNDILLTGYQNGGEFKGFASGFAYLAMETIYSDGQGATELHIKNIGGQPLNNSGVDEIAPLVAYGHSISGQYLPGQQTVIPRAVSWDMLDPFTTITVTVLDPDGKAVVSEDGTVLSAVPCDRDYSIILSKIGSYRVTYLSQDSQENLLRRVFSINSMDAVAPQITLSKTSETVKAGTRVQLPTYQVTDNHTQGNIPVSVFVKHPSQRITALSDSHFVPDKKGVYVISFMAFDSYNNMTIVEFILTVN